MLEKECVMVDANKELVDALDAIDAAALHYDDWLKCGAALHHEGCSVEDWRSWTARDVRPDHAHRLEQLDYKWRSFGNNPGKPVTAASVFKMAFERGYSKEGGERPRGRALALDEWIGGKGEEEAEPLLDPGMVGDFDEPVTPMFAPGHEAEELTAFIDALYSDNEVVAYVLDYQEDAKEDGTLKMKPVGRGVYTRTAGDIKKALGKGMTAGVGTIHPEAGAWWRINPLDGAGIGNRNVVDFRYVLLESDEMPVGKFASIVKQLNLPVAALVDSGGKSLHAVVRIGATDERQYSERVATLYKRCESNGIAVDHANRNPSRLMRMPGAMRNGRRQFLAGLSQGAADWEEWEEWYSDATDELPEAEPLDIDIDGPRPILPDEVIEGVLRIKSKMFLSGPSKAGKSFALIALCAAFASGGTWFGNRCKPSKVLYMNLELDKDECRTRFYDVMKALGVRESKMVIPWNLRGKGRSLSKLKKPLLRRIKKTGAEVVIIDPIYKVMEGDENNAHDISEFANTLDEIIEQAGADVVYCHHHSKGFQGGKRSIDRASGSGVFGRDADAILDMIELDVTDDDRWEFARRTFVSEVEREFIEAGKLSEWEAIPEKVRNVATNALENAQASLPGNVYERLSKRLHDIQQAWPGYTAWRITLTLRSFPNKRPVNVWFAWPIYVIDDSLKDKPEAGADDFMPKRKSKGKGSGSWSGSDTKKAVQANREKADSEHQLIAPAILDAFNKCIEADGYATVNTLYDRMPDIEGLGYPVTLAKVKEWTKERNPWCPIVKSQEKKVGKAAVLELRGDAGTKGNR